MRAKKKRTLLWALLLGLALSPLRAQEDPYADSLKTVLEQSMPDTLRVLTLTDLAFAYYNYKPEEAGEYARRAIALADRISYKRGLMKGYYSLAAALLTAGRYEEAIEASAEALKVAQSLGNASAVRGIYNLQGVIYRQWERPEEALQPLFQLLQISEEEGELLDAGLAAQNISTIYVDLDDTATAKDYALQAEKYFIESAAEEYLPGLYTNLSTLTVDNSRRLYYLKKAERISKSPSELVYIYHNLAGYYTDLQRADSTFYYLGKSLKGARETGDRYEELLLLMSLADAYHRLSGEERTALLYAEQGIDLAKSLGQKNTLGELYALSGEIQAALGHYPEAYQAQQRALALQDSVFTADLKEAQAEALARYEHEKQKAEIARQKLELERSRRRHRELVFGGLVLILFLTAAGYLFWMRQRTRAEKAKLLLEARQKEARHLRELAEFKSRFFNNIAHEYRTPLTLILGPLESLIGRIRERRLKEELLGIEAQATRLLQLTEEILGMARLDSGHIPLEEHPVQLAGTLRRICASYESAARVKGIDWRCEVEVPVGLIVRLDEDKLEKILNNLLGNALKFTPFGKCMRLRAQLEGEQLRVEVYNEGPGISAVDLPRIFERFYRGERAEAGAGMGLAFAKELCSLMGGSLQAESEEGEFARFVLSLPLQRQEEVRKAVAGPAAEATAWEPQLGHEKEAVILIVEDQPDMARFLQRLLEEEYHTLHASEGKEALEILRKQKVDLIISDVMMPGGMDGMMFRQEVAREGAWKLIPFVFLTARAEEKDRLKGFSLGADDYVVKPFSVRELRARLRSLLEKKREREKALRERGVGETLTADEEFLAQAERLALAHLDEPDFGVEELAAHLNYSSRHLARLLKELTGLSPVQFLLEIRLQRAYQLLKSKRFRTVSEVRYEVGMESASYFSKKFLERFGVRPSEV